MGKSNPIRTYLELISLIALMSSRRILKLAKSKFVKMTTESLALISSVPILIRYFMFHVYTVATG